MIRKWQKKQEMNEKFPSIDSLLRNERASELAEERKFLGN
jgi:hypothetical protein